MAVCEETCTPADRHGHAKVHVHAGMSRITVGHWVPRDNRLPATASLVQADTSVGDGQTGSTTMGSGLEVSAE